MAGGAAAVANELLVVHVRPHNVVHAVAVERVQLAVHPIFLVREISQFLQRQVLRRDHVSDVPVHVPTVGAFGAEAKRVIDAHFLENVLRPVPVVAGVAAHLAKATFVVRTRLLLFGGAGFRLFGVAVDALGVLLVAVTPFLEEAADGDLVLDVHVQVLAGVSLATNLFQPVYAHLLL